jgi:hypothetical protein
MAPEGVASFLGNVASRGKPALDGLFEADARR